MEIRMPPWRLQGPAQVRTRLDSARESPAAARLLISGLASALPVGVVADVKTIVSELVTNSVVHGTGDPIELRVEVTPAGDVRGYVSDGGAAVVSVRPPWDPAAGGLGLRIVEALTSRWGVCSPTSDVWFELAAPWIGPS